MTYDVTVSVPRIAFSTLACPEWDVATIVDRAAAMGYDAIEWRGGPDGHVRTSWSLAQRRELRERMADSNVTALAVTGYGPDVIAEVELAADLGAPFVRAFLTEPVDGSIAALAASVDRAHALGVVVAVEPHDDFVRADRVGPILNAVDRPDLGVVWDPANAWAAGDTPEHGLATLGARIRYVQLKDGVGHGESWQLTRLGEGEVPLERAVEGLAARGPLPPLSLEWERAWHPELDPAEVALGPALATIRHLLEAVPALR
jgi:sugar phosphate isomerase/epimerase